MGLVTPDRSALAAFGGGVTPPPDLRLGALQLSKTSPPKKVSGVRCRVQSSSVSRCLRKLGCQLSVVVWASGREAAGAVTGWRGTF